MVGRDPLEIVILVRVQVPQHFDSLCSLSAGPGALSEWGEVS